MYHAAKASDLPAGDAIVSLTGLVLSVVVPFALLVVVYRQPDDALSAAG